MSLRVRGAGSPRQALYSICCLVSLACLTPLPSALAQVPRPAPNLPRRAHGVDLTAVHENAQNEDRGARFVGQLRKPLSYYEYNGGEFWRLVKDKPWHGHDRERSCRGCTAGESSRMRIEAMSNVDQDPLTGLPLFGVVVGRVINIGNTTDQRTAIPPGPAGHPDHLYYIITDAGSAGYAALWSARVQFDANGTPRRHVQIGRAPVDFVKCPHHAEPARITSEGDFRACPGPMTGTRATSLDAKLTFVGLSNAVARDRLSLDDQLAWFSCDGGCCTAQWPPKSDSTYVGSAALRTLRGGTSGTHLASLVAPK